MGTPVDIPERFIRQIWQRQLFSTADLRTSDGRPVTILSPGTANDDGGPDFKDARVRVNQITYYGDVELHRDAASWQSHSHDIDPHYNKVILHVAMTANPLLPPACTASRRRIPLLVLHPFLDPALRSAWDRMIPGSDLGGREPLPCTGHSKHLQVELLTQWLTRLASERLELKIRRLHERLRQLADERTMTVREPYPRYYGDPALIPSPQKEYSQRDFSSKELWEQLLYEAIMECLGYAKNRKPFVALARAMTLSRLKRFGAGDAETVMVLLFGAAGLLPSSRGLPEKESRIYVRRLRQRWKTLRPHFHIPVLHEADWLFFRLRPGNFPTARLAAVAYILPTLFGGDGFRNLIGIFSREGCSPATRRRELRRLFAFTPDAFWRRHYHFRGIAGKRGASLGKERINDILINAIIPIALLYARVFKNAVIQSHAKQTLETMPSSPPNSITVRVSHALLEGRVVLRSALLQQGALQLYHVYCRQRRCKECVAGASRRTHKGF